MGFSQVGPFVIAAPAQEAVETGLMKLGRKAGQYIGEIGKILVWIQLLIEQLGMRVTVPYRQPFTALAETSAAIDENYRFTKLSLT